MLSQYLYLVEFIHFCFLYKPRAAFSLHFELIQFFSVRNRAPSQCILTPLPFHMCTQMHIPSLYSFFHCLVLQTQRSTREDPVINFFWRRDPSELRNRKRGQEQPAFPGYTCPAECQCHRTAQKRFRMKGRKKWISETPVDLSRGCTGVQMKSLTFMLASNAERYSQGQGSRGFPCTHLSKPTGGTVP